MCKHPKTVRDLCEIFPFKMMLCVFARRKEIMRNIFKVVQVMRKHEFKMLVPSCCTIRWKIFFNSARSLLTSNFILCFCKLKLFTNISKLSICSTQCVNGQKLLQLHFAQLSSKLNKVSCSSAEINFNCCTTSISSTQTNLRAASNLRHLQHECIFVSNNFSPPRQFFSSPVMHFS